ncbi:hypothetical protein LTR66_008102 [Elasticomyces elasticus]|nr:hypothetical protein LTR66_008102 [Elasticomyces elasticus]
MQSGIQRRVAESPSPPHQSLPVKKSLEVSRALVASSVRQNAGVNDHENQTQLPDGSVPILSDYPDSSQANRKPPRFTYRPWEIATKYDTRLFAVNGEYACTTGYITRVWSLRTGESLLSIAHGENVRVTAIAFKPTKDVDDEGKRLWLGTNIGDILELDIPSQSVIYTRSNAHTKREVVKLYRHAAEMWSLDDEGKLLVWSPDASGMPSLQSGHRLFRVPKGHACSMVSGGQLWIASGKDIRVFRPSASSDADFHVLVRPLTYANAGEVTACTAMSSQPDNLYFGHADGNVTIYNRNDYSRMGVVNVSLYKISSLAGVGDYLWAGYNTGMLYVYDTTVTPWQVKKDWHAHDNPVCSVVVDESSVWKMGRLQVLSLGTDNMLKIWDGMLEEDWLEMYMQQHDSKYCNFREVTASVLTWNAGASKPSHLRADRKDNNFFRDYLCSQDPPDLFVFGFQELVDLEDKKVTAKSFFKSKKKDSSEQEHMSHQYRAWRDHLTRCLEDFMPTSQPYTLLHTASMVGLFTCIFIKSSQRSRVRHINTAEVKRGMKGLHGNKGALVLRMVIDDTSVCLTNCHLAAGQTQTVSRNNDIAAILESECLPQSSPTSSGLFVGGGDGSMILDHEICILNGDLNYRIDSMPRDTVVKAVREGNLTKLLDFDQLLRSRRKNPGFRLRAFNENPITFAPTYKYDVGSDEYDTSEKRRAPAWCDRLLYRGIGRVSMEAYRRHELRVSDHRPVSGYFRLKVKTVDESKRNGVWARAEHEFAAVKQRIGSEVKLDYLTNTFGISPKEATRLLQG